MPKRRRRLFTPRRRSDLARWAFKHHSAVPRSHPPKASADWTAAFYVTKVVGKDATADPSNPAIGSFHCNDWGREYSISAIAVLVHRNEKTGSGLLLIAKDLDKIYLDIRTAWVVFAGDPWHRFSIYDDLDYGWRCCRQGAGKAEPDSWCALSGTQRCPFRNFRLFRIKGKGLPKPAEFGTGIPTRAYCMPCSEEDFGAIHRFTPKYSQECNWPVDFNVSQQPTIEVRGTKIVSLPDSSCAERTQEQLVGYIRDVSAMEGLVDEVASVLPVSDLPELIAAFAGVKVENRALFEGQRVRSRAECMDLYGFE